MERIQEEELTAHLLESNAEFRTLYEEHAVLDRQLHLLESKEHLTEEEQLDEVRMKKLKLRAKDRMAQILGHQAELVH